MTGLSLGLTEVLRQCVSLCNWDIHTKDTEQSYMMDDSKVVHKKWHQDVRNDRETITLLSLYQLAFPYYNKHLN